MAQRRIWGTFWHHDADSRFSRTNGTEKLLILSAFDLLGNLRFIQLTVFGSLNLMIDSDQLLLQSILAGRVQHLHCYRSCIRTPNIPQKNFIILRLFCVVTGCQLYKLRKRSDSLCKSQVPTYMAWVKAGCVHLYHVVGKTVIPYGLYEHFVPRPGYNCYIFINTFVNTFYITNTLQTFYMQTRKLIYRKDDHVMHPT